MSASPLTDFRIQHRGHGLAIYPPGAVFGPRLLTDFELVWIEDGNVVWHCDGTDYTALPGTILLARPGMRDGFTWDPRRATRHGYVHFTLTGSSPLLSSPTNWPLFSPPTGDDICRPLLNHLLWLLDAQPRGWQSLAESALQHALAIFVLQAQRGAASQQGDPSSLVMRTIDTVQQRWAGGDLVPYDLATLATWMQVSKAHLSRCFQREVGASPIEALRLVRLDRATMLLARTNASIATIAERCGFVDPFHFSRAFRAVYGVSPRTLRQRMARGETRPTVGLVRVKSLTERIIAPSIRNG